MVGTTGWNAVGEGVVVAVVVVLRMHGKMGLVSMMCPFGGRRVGMDGMTGWTVQGYDSPGRAGQGGGQQKPGGEPLQYRVLPSMFFFLWFFFGVLSCSGKMAKSL